MQHVETLTRDGLSNALILKAGMARTDARHLVEAILLHMCEALAAGENRGGRTGLHRDRQRIGGSSAGCFLELPIGGVMQGGRSPTGVTPPIGGQTHAAIITGRLSKYA